MTGNSPTNVYIAAHSWAIRMAETANDGENTLPHGATTAI